MNKVFHILVNKYTKSLIVIIITSSLLAKGPHGGWLVGVSLALCMSFVFTETIWLLNFKWYWNLLCALLLTPLSLLLSISLIKKIQFNLNPIIEIVIDVLITVIIFFALITVTNFTVKKIVFRNKN